MQVRACRTTGTSAVQGRGARGAGTDDPDFVQHFGRVDHRCARVGASLVHFVATRMGRVAYRRAGSGPALLLLHGGLSDGRSWTPQLQTLAEDHDVIAWDAPGCGGSDDPASSEATLADYADAVADLVDGLGVGPVHLAGHSFGSGLALLVYERHPHHVRSLLLSGAYAGWAGSLPPAEVEARRTALLADLATPHASWVERYLESFFTADVSAETRATARSMMLDVRPAAALPMVTAFAETDLRWVLPTVSVPTLLVYGAEDARAGREVAQRLHAAIAGSRLVLVPGAGHDVNLEAPAEYDATVRAFLG